VSECDRDEDERSRKRAKKVMSKTDVKARNNEKERNKVTFANALTRRAKLGGQKLSDKSSRKVPQP
jgi:hypothetical protein